MPHQCTNCDRRFPNGSKEMLSGCPDCGGKKFQFAPSTDDAGDEPTAATATQSGAESTSASDSGRANAAGSKSDPAPQREWPETAQRPAERDDVADRSDSAAGNGSWAGESAAGTDAMEDDFEWVRGDEDDAQATARSDVVSPDELPSHDAAGPAEGSATATGDSTTRDRTAATSSGPEQSSANPPEHGRVVSEPETDKPSIDELREELNQQFESIKILNPGQYELNLMELYDREEHIVSLQEDGRYVINVPESWHDDS